MALSSYATFNTVSFLAGFPSSGSIWVKPVISGALCQTASDRSASIVIGAVARTALYAGRGRASCAESTTVVASSRGIRALRTCIGSSHADVGVLVVGLLAGLSGCRVVGFSGCRVVSSSVVWLSGCLVLSVFWWSFGEVHLATGQPDNLATGNRQPGNLA